MAVVTRRELEIELSRLKGFTRPQRRLEQYVSDARSAAMMVHEAFIRGDVEGKVVADLGAGTGILAIGAALEGAREVYAVETDPQAVEVLRENLKIFSTEKMPVKVVQEDVITFDQKVNTVLMNPPFGKFIPHGDRKFLLKALEIAHAVYTFMNFNSEPFLRAISRDMGFKIELSRTWELEIRMLYPHHRKERFMQKVDFYVLRKAKEGDE